MRIRFLTGSIEPGKDGVGDYTLRLAEECARRDHNVEIVAFNDRYADVPIATVNSLRLPRGLPMGARLAKFNEWSRERPTPDWSSLQFVPYAFHRKGFVSRWTNPLRSLAPNARRQIMFHEIWIGQEPSAPLRHRLVGSIQRLQIRWQVRVLAPMVIHTNNEFYASILRKCGLDAKVLPLFGNIPLAPKFAAPDREAFFKKAGIENRASVFLVGIFGSIHPEWKPDIIIPALLSLCEKRGKRLSVVSLGRIGAGAPTWERMVEKYGTTAQFVKIGEVAADEVSRILQEFDAGLSLSPYEIAGKSGTMAAMLEHRLPVVICRFENTPEPSDPPPGIVTPSTLNRLFNERPPASARTFAAVAEQFVADLQSVP